MKIAILVSGQPRNFDLGYQELKKAYLDRYDCDVFFHTWDEENFQATHFFRDKPPHKYHLDSSWKEYLLDLYKPKEYLFEKQIVFDKQNIVDPVWRQPLQNTKSMFYSIQKSFELVDNTYDYYIRTRFDLMYEPDLLDLSKLSLEQLHVYNWDTDPRCKPLGYYDVFAIGSYNTIGIYSHVFERLDWYLYHDEWYREFLQGDSGLRNEYLLKYHMVSSGVPVKEHKNKIEGADGHVIR